MSKDRQSPLFTPIKDDRVHKEIHRRMLEKKKYESSPNLLRKKEAISQVRRLYIQSKSRDELFIPYI